MRFYSIHAVLFQRVVKSLFGTLFSLCACSPNPQGGIRVSNDAGIYFTDGGDRLDAQGDTLLSLEVGTGWDRFIMLEDGQTVSLVLGPQGTGRMWGYHIWAAVRTKGFEPKAVEIALSILRADSRLEIGGQTLALSLMPSDDSLVAYGLAPRLSDCCDAANQEIVLRATVKDTRGMQLTREINVQVNSLCTDVEGTDICP